LNAVSLRVEITEVSGARCDALMEHILVTAFQGQAQAKVLSRSGEPVDITDLGSLPMVTTGYVTTSYAVEAKRYPELTGQHIKGIIDL
jgi:hypothetical protein